MAKQPGGARDQRRRRIVETVDLATREIPKDYVEATLSNGIVLRGKHVNQSLMLRVLERHPTPEPPKFRWQAEDGEWMEDDNADDPEYQAALKEAYEDRLVAANRVMWTTGTQFVSAPEGVFGPDDDRWINEVGAFGLEPDVSTPQRRYHDWLTMYALQTEEDQTWAFAIALAETGTMERGVQEALEFFRREAVRGTDSQVPAEREGDDRNGADVRENPSAPGRSDRGT